MIENSKTLDFYPLFARVKGTNHLKNIHQLLHPKQFSSVQRVLIRLQQIYEKKVKSNSPKRTAEQSDCLELNDHQTSIYRKPCSMEDYF